MYYEHHDIRYSEDEVVPGLDALAVSFGLPPAAGFGAQPNSEFDGNEVDQQKQYAGFGELTIPLLSKLDFIAGIRVFHYEQNSQLNYAGIANDGVTSKTATTSESGSSRTSALTFCSLLLS